MIAVDWGVSEVATTKRWLGAIAEAGEASAGARYEVVRGDLLHLPFPDASVDRVIASEVLEHIPDDATAMAEIFRVLKPGGRVAVTVPRYGPERICWALSDEYHANEGGHIRIYRADVLRTRLAATGLVPGSGHHAHALHAPFWWLKCAVGVDTDSALVRAYHRLLVWDLTKRPWLTRTAERLLDPLFGKSLVVYADKPACTPPLPAAAPPRRGSRPLRRADRAGRRTLPELPGVLTADQLRDTVAWIADQQEPDGALPWSRRGQLDPWDSIEAAMALDVGGEHGRAAAAYRWLAARQRTDGSWASEYREGAETAPAAESNHAGYLAVGTWHSWLSSADEALVAELWPAVRRGLDLVTRMQLAGGAIGWALRPDGIPDGAALLTGNASLFQALRCGIALAGLLDEAQPDWELAVTGLGTALRSRPEDFADRSRFSMDWYYPVLAGAVTGIDADERLAADWDRFVVPGLGARCVADRPWVTGAETCELALALAAAGRTDAGSSRSPRCSTCAQTTAPTGRASSIPTTPGGRSNGRPGRRGRWCSPPTRCPGRRRRPACSAIPARCRPRARTRRRRGRPGSRGTPTPSSPDARPAGAPLRGAHRLGPGRRQARDRLRSAPGGGDAVPGGVAHAQDPHPERPVGDGERGQDDDRRRGRPERRQLLDQDGDGRHGRHPPVDRAGPPRRPGQHGHAEGEAHDQREGHGTDHRR